MNCVEAQKTERWWNTNAVVPHLEPPWPIQATNITLEFFTDTNRINNKNTKNFRIYVFLIAFLLEK